MTQYSSAVYIGIAFQISEIVFIYLFNPKV